jgi:hypothetical protein
MLFEAKDAGARRSVVAADAFEKAGTIADDMRRDVNGGIVPMDKFPVVPHFLKIVNRHSFLPGRHASALAVSAQFCFRIRFAQQSEL